MRDSIAAAAPHAEFKQVLIESMITDVIAELMVGVNADPQFGQLLVIASGGVLVELLEDACTLLLPSSDEQIRNALRELRCYRLLQGYRGKPAADMDTLIGCIRRLIEFAEERHERLLEMDVNPLLVTAGRCIAADVLIRETIS
jgi:succinyl-CoA synthetase beta subunit